MELPILIDQVIRIPPITVAAGEEEGVVARISRVNLEKVTIRENLMLYQQGYANQLKGAGGVVTRVERDGNDFKCDIQIVGSQTGKLLAHVINAKCAYHIAAYGSIDADEHVTITALEFVRD